MINIDYKFNLIIKESLQNERNTYFIIIYFIKLNRIKYYDNPVIYTHQDAVTFVNNKVKSLSRMSPSRRELFKMNTIKYFEEYYFKESEFTWIKNGNERLIYWAFCYVTYNHMKKYLDDMNVYSEYDYINYPELLPTSKNEIFEYIIRVFDCWNVPCEYKRLYLNRMKQYWATIYTYSNSKEWLNLRNERQCLWAWDYLQEKGVIFSFLCPVGREEKFHSINAIIDYVGWGNANQFSNLNEDIVESESQDLVVKEKGICSFSDAARVIKGMYNAWNQMSYRGDQKKSSKQVTTSKQSQLAEISKLEGKSKKIILDNLILSKYKALGLG